MSTTAERDQFVHTVNLALHLHAAGVPCSMSLPIGEAPIVRVIGLDLVEATARSDGVYEIWGIDEPVAPIRCDQSLADAVAFLSRPEHRA